MNVLLDKVYLAYSNYLIENLDLICSSTSQDIVPLLAQGDSFLDALEHALLAFLRHGCVTHILGLEPFAFVQFNRAIVLLNGLLSKLWFRVT